MKDTTSLVITIALAAFILWTYIFYIPSLKSVTGQENKALEAKNKTLDSMLVSKQRTLDSASKASEYWNTKFLTVLSDTNRVKIKYIGIKEGVNSLSNDSAFLYFIQRTR